MPYEQINFYSILFMLLSSKYNFFLLLYPKEYSRWNLMEYLPSNCLIKLILVNRGFLLYFRTMSEIIIPSAKF